MRKLSLATKQKNISSFTMCMAKYDTNFFCMTFTTAAVKIKEANYKVIFLYKTQNFYITSPCDYGLILDPCSGITSIVVQVGSMQGKHLICCTVPFTPNHKIILKAN